MEWGKKVLTCILIVQCKYQEISPLFQYSHFAPTLSCIAQNNQMQDFID